MLLRHVALGDREEAREAALAREHVVVARVEPALVQVVADREELAVRVEEHREVGVLPHLACDVGVEAQPREQFDAARARHPGHVSAPCRELGRPAQCAGRLLARAVERVERVAESLGEADEARHARAAARASASDRLHRPGARRRRARAHGASASSSVERLRGSRDRVGDRAASAERRRRRAGLDRQGDRSAVPTRLPSSAERRSSAWLGTSDVEALAGARPLAEVVGVVGELERAREPVERLAQPLASTSAAPSAVLLGDEVLERERRRVASAAEQLRAEERRLGRLEQRDAQHEQVAGEVAGVDGRDVGRPQRLRASRCRTSCRSGRGSARARPSPSSVADAARRSGRRRVR